MARKWSKAARAAMSKRMKEMHRLANGKKEMKSNPLPEKAADIFDAIYSVDNERLLQFLRAMEPGRQYTYDQLIEGMRWYLEGWKDSKGHK